MAVHWSQQILDDVTDHLQANRPGFDTASARRLVEAMNTRRRPVISSYSTKTSVCDSSAQGVPANAAPLSFLADIKYVLDSNATMATAW